MTSFSVQAIVPTVPGREASLDRLAESLLLTAPEVEVVPILNSKTCGWGWDQGMQASDADYLLLACDDQEFVRPGWLPLVVETVDAGQLPCPRVWFADGRIESQGGDMSAPHHLINRPQRDGTAVDYTTIPFMSRDQAQAIGMLPDLHYCTDVWVSYRWRQLGGDTVLRQGYDVVHHHESVGRGAGMGQAERDQMDERAMREELARCAS